MADGSVEIKVLLDDSKAVQGLKKFTEVGAKTAKAVGGAFIAAGGAVTAATIKVSESADRVDKLSQRLGLSREAFQEWDFVMSQSGVSIDSMQSGMKNLTQRMDEANNGVGKGAEAFEKLGVSIDESMTQEEAFEATIKGLQGMEDGVERAALAQDLFGKSGQEIIPLLNMTAEETEALKEQAHELGIVMGDETVDAGVQMQDALDQLQRVIGGAFAQAVTDIMPFLTQLMQTFMEIVPVLIEQLQPSIEALLPVFFELIESILPIAIELFIGLIPPIVELVEAFLPILIELFNKLIPPLLEIISAIMPVLIQLLDALMPLFDVAITLLQPILDLFIALLGPILDLISQAIAPLIQIIGQLLQQALIPLIPLIEFISDLFVYRLTETFKNIMPFIQNVIGVFKSLLDFIKSVFVGDWEAAWQAVKNIFKNVFQGLVNLAKFPINQIISGINTFLRGLNKIKIPDWVPGVGGKGFSIPLIPKLAEGGLLYGESLIIAGDNPDAAVNPEVVAPLNDLQNMFNTKLSAMATQNISIDARLSGDINVDGFQLAKVVYRHLDDVNYFS